MTISPKTWRKCGIIALFLITGSINTLAAKWANTMTAIGDDGKEVLFRHSFLQTWGMFLGESLCMVAFCIYKLFWRRTSTPNQNGSSVNPENAIDEPPTDEVVKFSPFWLLPPAMIDLVAT